VDGHHSHPPGLGVNKKPAPRVVWASARFFIL
jgi:hypothetical protein